MAAAVREAAAQKTQETMEKTQRLLQMKGPQNARVFFQSQENRHTGHADQSIRHPKCRRLQTADEAARLLHHRNRFAQIKLATNPKATNYEPRTKNLKPEVLP